MTPTPHAAKICPECASGREHEKGCSRGRGELSARQKAQMNDRYQVHPDILGESASPRIVRRRGQE